MPTGPKGQKRPADVICNAVRVMQAACVAIAERWDNIKPPANAIL